MQIYQIREQYNKAMNQIYKAKPKISYIMEIVFGLIFIGFNAIILSINLASGHTFLPFVIIPGILIFIALVSIIIVIKKFIKYKKNDKDK